MRSFLLLPLLLLWAAACQDAAPPLRPPVAIPAEAVNLTFGQLDDTTLVETFHYPRDGAISETGRFVALADFSAPYLRVLDQSSDSVWVFGLNGEGPGELPTMTSVEFLGDTSVIVLSRLRVDRFSPRGVWLGGDPLREWGILGLAITRSCRGEVVAYGVPENHARLDTTPYLHLLADSGRTILSLPERAFPRYGRAEALDGNSHGIALWHRGEGYELGLFVPCAPDASPRVLHGEEPWEAGNVRTSGAGTVAIMPDTLFQGAVALERGILRSRSWMIGDRHATEFKLFTGQDGCSILTVWGQWRLFDSSATELLLARYQPFPQFRLLRLDWLVEQLEASAC